MSLSKPFRLSHLPLLPLENVLLLTEPRDLLLFALSSEKARELLRKFSLVEYFDIDVPETAVQFSFRLKSGKLIIWTVRKCFFDWKFRKPTDVFELDAMRMDVMGIDTGVECGLSHEHFSAWTQRIGYFFHSIFPCQRIRKLGAGKVGSKVTGETLFHMDRITSCEKFRFLGYDGDNFLELLKKIDVKKEITLMCDQYEDLNLEWMNNETIRNIPSLKLFYVENLDISLFLKLENEHLNLENCRLTGSNSSLGNVFLKKWMNGEFTKRRTLRVTGDHGHRFDDTVFNGLTKEPLETWEKLGKPELVQFSDKIYLNPTPRTVPERYQTVLLKNCHGQFATVVQTSNQFYFVSWDHPLPPINVPAGHELLGHPAWPFKEVKEVVKR